MSIDLPPSPSEKPIPQPRFTGVFIPVEILEMEDLSLLDKILLSWIDALYCKNHKGCFASNEYLGKKLGSEANTIAKAIGRLRKLGFLEDVSFDGRIRVIRCCMFRVIEMAQGKAALDKNPRGVGQKSNAGLDKNPEKVPPQLYTDDSKDYSKVRGEDPPPSKDSQKSKKKSDPKAFSFGAYVTLKEGEYENLIESYGKEIVDYYIESLNNYVPNNKPYKDYAAVIRQWYLRDKKDGKTPKVENLQVPDKKETEIENNRSLANTMNSRYRHEMKMSGDGLEGNAESVWWVNHLTQFKGEKIFFRDKDFKKKISHEFIKRNYR